MLTFHTADGHRVRLAALHLLANPFLVHDPHERQASMAALVQHCFPNRGELPALVRWEPGSTLGAVVALALFDGKTLEMDPAEGNSMLIVCWPVWHAERNVREIVEPAVEGLVWADYAADFGWW